MQQPSHPALAELQTFLLRHGRDLTPGGAHRLHAALLDVDTLYADVQALGGIDAIKAAMTKKKSAA